MPKVVALRSPRPEPTPDIRRDMAPDMARELVKYGQAGGDLSDEGAAKNHLIRSGWTAEEVDPHLAGAIRCARLIRGLGDRP